MSNTQFPDRQVLEVIVRSPSRMLDEIVFECPGVTWNQVFIIIDRLQREGALTVSLKERGRYAITFPATQGTLSPPRGDASA